MGSRTAVRCGLSVSTSLVVFSDGPLSLRPPLKFPGCKGWQGRSPTQPCPSCAVLAPRRDGQANTGVASLTLTERRVAELVGAEGLTNRQGAQFIFVTQQPSRPTSATSTPNSVSPPAISCAPGSAPTRAAALSPTTPPIPPQRKNHTGA